jgi:ribosomal protein S24E
MKLVSIKPSSNVDKKLMAIFEQDNGRTIMTHFGARNYMDYTKYYKQDKELAKQKKASYLARHKVNEDWNDVSSAGALSRWILWDKPTIESSVNDFKPRFNL